MMGVENMRLYSSKGGVVIREELITASGNSLLIATGQAVKACGEPVKSGQTIVCSRQGLLKQESSSVKAGNPCP